MPSPESLQIRPYLLASKNAPRVPLAEQRVGYELLVENYVGHPVPLPEGTRVESVDVDGMWHVFQAWAYVLPEGQQSIENMGRFIRRQTKLS